MEDLALILLLALLPLLFLSTFRVKAGRSGDLRPLPGVEELPGLLGRSLEFGQPVHLSLGVAGLGGPATAETWAGFTVLARFADEAAASGVPLIVTVGDATALPIAQDMVRRAYARHGNLDDYEPTQMRLVAPDPTAYAAGVMGMLGRDPLTANVMVGSFGDEYLLMGEVGARQDYRQTVGAAQPATLPFALATADDPWLGEEMFAGGSYLNRLPMQLGSLVAEDWTRWLVVVGIVIAAAWQLLA
jgi:hypothetical protein